MKRSRMANATVIVRGCESSLFRFKGDKEGRINVLKSLSPRRIAESLTFRQANYCLLSRFPHNAASTNNTITNHKLVNSLDAYRKCWLTEWRALCVHAIKVTAPVTSAYEMQLLSVAYETQIAENEENELRYCFLRDMCDIKDSMTAMKLSIPYSQITAHENNRMHST